MDNNFAVETHGLTKRYRSRVVAVDGLDLSIRRGEIYGLLGPNGAGKTTTLRMLLGLVRPTSGVANVLGKTLGHPESLARTGAMVEYPAFYPFLSGRDNLRAVARRAGVSDVHVEEAIKIVQLDSRAKDKFGKYSLGMKQRLGVAAALIKDPELLILDEPSNGLDPPGQDDMQALIRDLGAEGRTVILSSHNLVEVEHLCDRVGVVSGGRLTAEGTIEELRSAGGPRGLLVRADPPEAAVYLAEKLAGVEGVTLRSDGMLMLDTDPGQAASICRKLVAAGLEVSELRRMEERSFEEVFRELTGGRTAGADSVRAGQKG